MKDPDVPMLPRNRYARSSTPRAVIRWTSLLESVPLPGSGALVNVESSCNFILWLSGLETTDNDISSGRSNLGVAEFQFNDKSQASNLVLLYTLV
jgi:hypothetical protein